MLDVTEATADPEQQTATDEAKPPAATPIVPLRDADQLSELLGTPHPLVIEKVHAELTEDDLSVLARSPFCVLSTADAAGNCDASPRGVEPGSLQILGPSTIALPDRPGNRRGDNFRNILENPHVGLLFLVPGSSEVLRVNGRATIVTDGPFFDAMAHRGRRPVLATVVEIDEIYRHCPASLRRAKLWDTSNWPYDE